MAACLLSDEIPALNPDLLTPCPFIAQIPTALEASGAIRPGDEILSVNGLPLPGGNCYRRDEELLKAPGMFPMRLRIYRPRANESSIESSDWDEWGELAGATGLEGSLSRLKQVRAHVRLLKGILAGTAASPRMGMLAEICLCAGELVLSRETSPVICTTRGLHNPECCSCRIVVLSVPG